MATNALIEVGQRPVGRPEACTQASFCSRCGRPPGDPGPRREPWSRGEPCTRVCARCGMGVILSCRSDSRPGPHTPFLIVGGGLVVGAVSAAGESLFGAEQDVVGTSLPALLTSPLDLERHSRLAAQRPREPVVLPVRLPSGSSRERSALLARIATCGPPRAALIAVERAPVDAR